MTRKDRKHQLGFAGRIFTGNINCGSAHRFHHLTSLISVGSFFSRKISNAFSLTTYFYSVSHSRKRTVPSSLKIKGEQASEGVRDVSRPTH